MRLHCLARYTTDSLSHADSPVIYTYYRSSRRLFCASIIVVVLGAIAGILFFFIPRSIIVKQLSFRPSNILFVNGTKPYVTFDLQETFLVSNPNYASVTIDTISLSIEYQCAPPCSFSTFVGQVTQRVDRSFNPRTSGGTYAFQASVKSELPIASFSQLKSVFEATCDASRYYFLVIHGSSHSSFLSLKSDEDIDQYAERVPCNQ
jgi:hypothetical protein